MMGCGVYFQFGFWLINNMVYGQMYSMVVSNIWVVDLNFGGVMVVLFNDGRIYYGVMIDEGQVSNVLFMLQGGEDVCWVVGIYGLIIGCLFGFNMMQVWDCEICDGGLCFGSDFLFCN